MSDAILGPVTALLLMVPVPAAAQNAPADEAAVPRIGPAEFRQALSAGRLVVLDVRTP